MSEWIEWNGGKMPVDGNAIVDIRSHLCESLSRTANFLEWRSTGHVTDILCYRLSAPAIKQSTEQKKHSHYYKDVRHLDTIDMYRVLQLFGVTDPCLQHAAKKVMFAGTRGAKDMNKDVQEAIDSLTRWIDMRAEEARAK